MKISQVENRIDASYNTIKRFVEGNELYYKKIDGIIHVTETGILKLEEKYGVKTEVMSDKTISFYKNQIIFMEQQLKEIQKYNESFLRQIEMKDYEYKEIETELMTSEKRIKGLEKELHQKDIEKLKLEHELEVEKNKSFFQKLFKK